MRNALRVLMITSEWPSAELPFQAPVVVRQVEFLRRCGVDVKVFPFRGSMRPGNYLKAWASVQREVRRKRYDLIHAQWGQSALPAINKPLPLVVTYRGSDLEGIVGGDGRYTTSGRILATLSRFVARLADQVIVVSRSLADKLPNRPYHIIPSGVDLDQFKPMPKAGCRRELGLDLEKRYVLFAADKSNPVKRYDLAQAAVEQLRPRMDVELLSLGNVPHARMPVWMNACDALLLTSRHEGSPDVIKEAIACNLPVVSTDVGDVRERLEGIGGCFICEDDRPESVAYHLDHVLQLLRRLDAQTAARELDESTLTQKVIEVYETVI